ncbi:hypothetical protein C8R43DRAFT_954820 [Mycena crocata]|nr:hypothetical protein C8R43DRAFT_956140 [Mycena crocata]KAJ7140532.1 hypothetical protein C8R43DRAFT_954820 [Mycena crocata]
MALSHCLFFSSFFQFLLFFQFYFNFHDQTSVKLSSTVLARKLSTHPSTHPPFHVQQVNQPILETYKFGSVQVRTERLNRTFPPLAWSADDTVVSHEIKAISRRVCDARARILTPPAAPQLPHADARCRHLTLSLSGAHLR